MIALLTEKEGEMRRKNNQQDFEDLKFKVFLLNEKVHQVDNQSVKSIERIQARLDSLEDKVMDSRNILSSKEAARYLGLSLSYLYQLAKRGEIAYSKPQRKMLFEKRALEKWILNNRNEGL